MHAQVAELRQRLHEQESQSQQLKQTVSQRQEQTVALQQALASQQRQSAEAQHAQHALSDLVASLMADFARHVDAAQQSNSHLDLLQVGFGQQQITIDGMNAAVAQHHHELELCQTSCDKHEEQVAAQGTVQQEMQEALQRLQQQSDATPSAGIALWVTIVCLTQGADLSFNIQYSDYCITLPSISTSLKHACKQAGPNHSHCNLCIDSAHSNIFTCC